MASISTEKKTGRRAIQFTGVDGKRRTIRLGNVSKRQSEAFKHKIELIVAAQMTGHAMSDEAARWVGQLDSVMAGKLSRVGLLPKRDEALFAAFVDTYVASRVDLKRFFASFEGETGSGAS